MSLNEMEEDDAFSFVEKNFVSHLQHIVIPEDLEHENVCCSETEKCFIKLYVKMLGSIIKYNAMSKKDKYLTLIYIYYALHLNEQSTDWLNMQFLKDNSDDYMQTRTLYLDITTGDIQINISSFIRKQMLGL